MRNEGDQKVWVAVRVQRGFITEIKAYRGQKAARQTERRWRKKMNPDYDETGLSCVPVK